MFRIFSNLCFCLPFSLFLYIIQWKKKTIRRNLALIKLQKHFSYFKFYHNASTDFLAFLLSLNQKKVFLCTRDLAKLRGLQNSGGLLLSAHYHNWELIGAWFASKGIPLISLTKPMKNSFWNSTLARIRGKKQMNTLNSVSFYNVANAIKEKSIFGILLDQRNLKNSVKNKFFGHTIRQSALAELLYKKTNCPCYFIIALPNHQFRLIQLFGESSKTHKNLTARYNRVLETLVKSEPHYWYGLTHKIFKIKTFDPYS